MQDVQHQTNKEINLFLKNIYELYDYTELHIASYDKDSLKIESLLQQDKLLNVKNAFGETPLHLYVLSGEVDLKIIKKFINQNANLKILSSNELYDGEDTVLHYACLNPKINFDILEFLIKKEPWLVSNENNNDFSPLKILFTTAPVDILTKFIFLDMFPCHNLDPKVRIWDEPNENEEIFSELLVTLKGRSARDFAINFNNHPNALSTTFLPDKYNYLSKDIKKEILVTKLCFHHLFQNELKFCRLPKFVQFYIFKFQAEEELLKLAIKTAIPEQIFNFSKDLIQHIKTSDIRKRKLISDSNSASFFKRFKLENPSEILLDQNQILNLNNIFDF